MGRAPLRGPRLTGTWSRGGPRHNICPCRHALQPSLGEACRAVRPGPPGPASQPGGHHGSGEQSAATVLAGAEAGRAGEDGTADVVDVLVEGVRGQGLRLQMRVKVRTGKNPEGHKGGGK